MLPDANSASTAGSGLGSGCDAHDAARQRPAEQLAPLLEVLHLLRVGAGVEVRRVLELVVGDRQLEAVAEDLELGLAELLRLVGDVAGLDARAERPALDRLGQDHRRGADVLGRRLVGGVDLAVVVAAAAELEQVVVGEVLDDPAQPRVRAEEVLADVVAARHRVLLELAVERLVHLLDQHAVDVAREQLVPLAAPDDLDHVPAGAAEQALELLDDLAVAPDRAVEALQVAVDDEGQVVEAVAGGERDAGDRLGLVHLAVAEERPDALLARVPDPPVLQVAVEPRLVDGGERAEAHRDRRELPEVRHQPGVRVRAQALAARPRAGSGRAGPRTGGPRGRRGRRCRAPRGPGRTPGRRRPDRPCP